MSSDYRTYVTQTGFGLEALAKQSGTGVFDGPVWFVVGDTALDDKANPADQTDLVNQVRSYGVTIEQDESDPTIWIARVEIPANDGGFFIREAGVRVGDRDSGYLYCYARQGGDYKPNLEEGQGKSYTIRLKFIPGNASVINAKIDPSVQFATPTDLRNAIAAHESAEDPHPQYLAALEHLSAENPHPQYALAESVAVLQQNVFIKSQVSIPAFKVADDRMLKTACALSVTVDGVVYAYPADTVIYMPSIINSDLDKGFDLAIYATASGLVASQNFTVPGYTDGVPDSPFFTEENTRRIGGIHYQGGGNYLWLNPHSAYDLHYRPACDDPRGMVRTLAGFWADIYLLNTTPDALGTSAYNAQIADGSSPPKRPIALGGDGSVQYSNFTQYVAAEVLAAYGKRLPNHHEFSVLAHGSETGYAVASDPVTTKFDARARSTIGCEQVSGHLYQWGAEVWDRGNGSSGYAWYAANTNGKGQVHSAGSAGVGAALFGGDWANSGFSGSRCSAWRGEPWSSGGALGARGVCDHLQLA